MRYTNSWVEEYDDDEDVEEEHKYRNNEVNIISISGHMRYALDNWINRPSKKLFIVMELCDNRTLKDVINEEKLFETPARVKEIFGQICKGMCKKIVT